MEYIAQNSRISFCCSLSGAINTGLDNYTLITQIEALRQVLGV